MARGITTISSRLTFVVVTAMLVLAAVAPVAVRAQGQQEDDKPTYSTLTDDELAAAKIKVARKFVFRLKQTSSGNAVSASSVSALASIFTAQDVTLEWTGEEVGMSIARINEDAFAAEGGSTVESAQAFAKKKIESLQAAVASSAADISFDFIESDDVAYGTQAPPATTPNDPSFGQLWGMTKIGVLDGQPNAGEPGAWNTTTGSNNVTVLVIDTGVDYNHPDLAANMWRNPGEIPGNGQDDDGNGYVDDVYGINAIANNGNPMDDHSHGTHCAGTIGAVGNNGVGVVGVSQQVKIAGCKFLSQSNWGSYTDAVECINYGIRMGFTLTSNSWGGAAKL
ncbi:subtilisin-like protease [Pycnococcus provasolii]